MATDKASAPSASASADASPSMRNRYVLVRPTKNILVAQADLSDTDERPG